MSNSLKIIQGGWFPLAVGAVIAILMLSWRRGSLEVRRRLYDMSILPIERFLTYVDDLVIGRAPGLGVWLTKVEHGASPMLIRHLEHNRVFHERVALLSFVFDRRPRVPFHERHKVERIGHGFYRVQVRLGFMQTPDIPRSLENIRMLGVRRRSRAQALLSRARDRGAAREEVGDGPYTVRDLFVLQQDFEPRAGLFQDPERRRH